MADINALRAKLTPLPDDLDSLPTEEKLRLLNEGFEVFETAMKRIKELEAELKNRGALK